MTTAHAPASVTGNGGPWVWGIFGRKAKINFHKSDLGRPAAAKLKAKPEAETGWKLDLVEKSGVN